MTVISPIFFFSGPLILTFIDGQSIILTASQTICITVHTFCTIATFISILSQFHPSLSKHLLTFLLLICSFMKVIGLIDFSN